VSTVRLPSDALVVLVGVAGSGKTTLAARSFAPDEVLASDAFRATVAGDEADQSATAAAFRLLHAALEQRMARGLLTVVDATSTQTWARRGLLAIARRHGRPSAAIVLDLPVEISLERNARRATRHVPSVVVRRQQRELRRTLPDLGAEGHVAVVILRDVAAVDELTVERVGTPGAGPSEVGG
jgi:protein phosphatase